jgi:hypothetical protein
MQDMTKPSLFPDYLWHSSGRMWDPDDDTEEPEPPVKRPQSAVYLIRKSREIQHRMQTSPYYLRQEQQVDVVRYERKPRVTMALLDRTVMEHMGSAASSQYTPQELLTKKLRSATADSGPNQHKQNVSLEDYESKENKGDDDEGDDEEEAEVLSLEQEEEEEENEDYIMNYYASEEESDGGGGGEPTF